MDFHQDPGDFSVYLGQTARDITHARTNFLDRLDHWKRLADHKYGQLLSIDQLPEQRGFAGSVLGKPFSLLISPLVVQGRGRIEVVVTIPSLAGKETEISRFNVDRNGDLADEYEITGGDFDGQMGLKILMGVVKEVLEHPVPAGH
ncbi:hypothetical protein [Pseudomonas sp. NBRC 111124]|uniref:hypothetical protein n=1 Tax=Pseudomonas sp. NBRC 111124 TaxID=1661039 RepID=UPI000760CE11|nr:hypothetical protein [Pseudomonas sp. NBRC 111124]